MKFDQNMLIIGGVLAVGALVVFKRDWVCAALAQVPVDLPLGNFCLEHSKNVIREVCADDPNTKYCQEHPEFTAMYGGYY